jgi:pimeloyl-ACP methyl ester carboxylesterase
MRMRITTDDGVDLEVEVTGEGPGLILIHGHGGAKEDFADHVPGLARDHTVVVFDLRGHGASDKPTDAAAYSLDRLAADTVAVADAVGLGRFRLLGHSLGGMIARKVAIREAARIDALIMMDTCAGPIPGFDASLVEIGCEVALSEGKEALKELMDFVRYLETPAHERLVEARPGFTEFEARKWADVSMIAWVALAREVGKQSDDLPALTASPFPLLVIVGDQDEAFLRTSHAMHEGIPGAELATIPDAGHSPQVENPDAWFAALTGFLSALPAAAR